MLDGSTGDSTEGVSAQSGQGKPCRYGLECTRPNCKFGHGGQPMKHSESFTGKSSNHWVPSNLHCKVQSEGGLVCQKPDENREEFLSVSNNFCRMELLFILKSEVIVDILLF